MPTSYKREPRLDVSYRPLIFRLSPKLSTSSRFAPSCHPRLCGFVSLKAIRTSVQEEIEQGSLVMGEGKQGVLIVSAGDLFSYAKSETEGDQAEPTEQKSVGKNLSNISLKDECPFFSFPGESPCPLCEL
jgi:hypothetical protein